MTIDATEQQTAVDEADASGRHPQAVPFLQVGSLSSTRRDPATGTSTYFIKTSGSEILEFGEREYFLWRLLDGKSALADIEQKFKARFAVTLTAEQFGRFIDQLIECGAVERVEPNEAAPSSPRPLPIIASSEPPEHALPMRTAFRRRGISLFDPSIALRALDTLFGPSRFFRWLLLPSLAGVLLWFSLDPSVSTTPMPTLQLAEAFVVIGLALLAVGVMSPLSQAVTASFLGYPSHGCRIVFRGWLLPTLVFDDIEWYRIPSHHVLTVVGAPCVARLALFVGGAGAWLATRETGDWFNALSLVVTVIALASFLVSTAPFLPTQGRRWLATVFGYVDLRTAGGAYRPQLAILTILWLAVVGGCLGLAAATILGVHHPAWYDPELTPVVRSTSLAILAIAFVFTPLWLRGMVNRDGALQRSYGYPEGTPDALYRELRRDGDPRHAGMLVDASPGRPGRRQAPERWPSSKSIVVWAVIVGCVVAVAFVAYPYEAGGNFTILPHDSNQLNARVQGELTEVLVNEGDDVTPGQILGILSDWQQKYNLAIATTQLQNAEASLRHLLEAPRPEDVELARKQYEAALARLPYDKAQFERYAALVTNDNVSRSNYDQVLSQYQQDQAAAEVARANYDQVRAPPTQAQIDTARAQVRQYTATVAFAEDELERTRIRATSYGTVVTPNPMLLRGKSFAQGALVFTVEDHKLLQADVQVPETDIDNVRLGGSVRLRFWGIPEKTFHGKAVAIAPSAQTPSSASPQSPQSGNSNVVRVRALVANPDGVLRPNTDGYAKIAGLYMPAWQAFGQVIQRFALVEIWSWVP